MRRQCPFLGRLSPDLTAARYIKRVSEAGIEASADSAGASHDKALAETICKAETVHRRGP
ncbi:hypothetical protein GCM10023209_12550 [Roseibacterium beibuensis]|uniref:Transposase n=1 Tax=[Roseibacterium] beibuensis TaxID=1193142 RepID=A0ABP9L871_9RHOB